MPPPTYPQGQLYFHFQILCEDTFFSRAHLLAEAAHWACSVLWVPEWMNQNQGGFSHPHKTSLSESKSPVLIYQLEPKLCWPKNIHPYTQFASNMCPGMNERATGKNQQVHQWEFKPWGLARRPGKGDKFSKYQDVGQYSKDEIHWYYSPSLTLPSNSMFHPFPLQCNMQMFHCSL